jgi:hypothetical protein
LLAVDRVHPGIQALAGLRAGTALDDRRGARIP